MILSNETTLAFQVIPIIEAEQQKYSQPEQQNTQQPQSIVWETGRGCQGRFPTISGRERLELGKFHAATTLPKDVNLHLSIALLPVQQQTSNDHQDSSPLDERRILRDPSALWHRGCLVFRLRMRGLRTHNRLGYSVCAYPFGSLKPEQLWRSDRATHQLQWTRPDGTYQVSYRRRGLGKVELRIGQLIISDGGGQFAAETALLNQHFLSHWLNVSESGESCFHLAYDVVWENQGRRNALLAGNSSGHNYDEDGCYCEVSGSAAGLENYTEMFSSNPKYLGGSLAAWSTDEGIPVASLATFQLPNPYWEWIGDWRVDEVSPGVGTDGWIYCSSTVASNPGKWHDRPRFGTRFRRRRWVRFRRLKQQPESPSKLSEGSPRSLGSMTDSLPRNDREKIQQVTQLLSPADPSTEQLTVDSAAVMASLDYDRSRMILIERLLSLERTIGFLSEDTCKAVAASAHHFFPVSPKLRRQMIQTVLGHYQSKKDISAC